MIRTLRGMILLLGVLVCTGCASVSVTKTAKGFYSPTQADDIEILMTRTDRDYIELATVATANWNPSETAKMHNAMRAKTAPLGANAVIILESGIIRESAFSSTMWTSGVAIRYKNDDEKASSQ